MGLVHSVVQTVLNGTSIALGNTTMFPCGGLAAEINNEMKIHVPPGIPTIGLVGVHLDSFNMSMTAESCDGSNCTVTPLGYFPTEGTWLALGNNKVHWDVGATLADSSSLINNFIVPLFLQNKTVNLKLKSEDVALWLRFTVLPSYTFKQLTLEKTLSCRMLGTVDTKEIPDKFCHPKQNAGGRRLDSGQGYSIVCEAAAPSPPPSPSPPPPLPPSPSGKYCCVDHQCQPESSSVTCAGVDGATCQQLCVPSSSAVPASAADVVV
jgi:hypothetical protein